MTEPRISLRLAAAAAALAAAAIALAQTLPPAPPPPPIPPESETRNNAPPPKNGRPYFLIPDATDGTLLRREGFDPGLKVPLWLLFSF